MIANIISFSAGPLQEIPLKGITVEFNHDLEKLLSEIKNNCDRLHVRVKITYKDAFENTRAEEQNTTFMGRSYDRNITIRSWGGAIGGWLKTDIVIPE